MNERIRELEKQSVVYNEDEEIWETDLEKFALLIVRECARIARNTDLEDVEGGDSAVLRAVGEQIEQHFGVE